MKNLKRFGTLTTGVIIGIVFSIGVTAFAAGTIKSAEYNSNKVLFDGVDLNLTAPLISVIDEATPQNSANYMPVRAVLEAMGYEVNWDAATSAINIKSPAEKPADSIPLAKVTMNGVEVTVPGSSGSAPEYAVDYKVVMDCMERLGFDSGWEVGWDKKSATITAVPRIEELEEPLAIRVLLTKLEEQGIAYDLVFTETKREVYLTKGSLKATIFLPMQNDAPTATVSCGKNKTDITLVYKGGTSYINERELLDALKKVGFLK